MRNILLCTDLIEKILPNARSYELRNTHNLQIYTLNIATLDQADSAHLLTEYDLIIIDFNQPLRSFDEQRIKQIFKFLSDKNKNIIFLLNSHQAPYRQGDRMSNYALVESFLRQHLGLQKHEIVFNTHHHGINYQITSAGTKSIFNKYLEAKNKNWQISSLNLDPDKLEALAINNENEYIAFCTKIFEGHAYFLPKLINNFNEFWGAVIQLLSNTGHLEPVPDWVEGYTVPRLGEINKHIEGIDQEIKSLEDKRSGFQTTKEELEFIRDSLLFRKGDILHKAVKDALNFLGLEAEYGPKGKDDLRFSYGDNDYIIEVKGNKHSAAESHIKDLKGHVTEYESETCKKAIGLLISNSWCETPLIERDTSSKPIFPEQILKKTMIWDLKLLTTTQLFIAYCLKLEGNFDLDNFIQSIFSANPIVLNYKEIERFSNNALVP